MTTVLSVGPGSGIEVRGVTAADFHKTALAEGERLLAAVAGFRGRTGECLLLPRPEGATLLLGLGDGSVHEVRRAFAAFRSRGDRLGAWRHRVPAGPDARARLAAAAEGWWLGGYSFERYRAGAPAPEEPAAGRGEGTLVPPAGMGAQDAQAVLDRTAVVMDAVALTRDLVNTPAMDLHPGALCDAARAVARETGMGFHCWTGDELAEERFSLIAAVGAGSAHRPALVRLTLGDPGARGGLALVGKGVTFDSGGLDLKTADGMALMKKDMAGAATVLGAMSALSRLRSGVNARAYLPIAENMTGERAFRPGDVLRSRSGITVEIGNTDAEGRLLLADAISLAVEDGASRIVDVATLTGACRVALGKKIMGLFANDDAMAAAISTAAEATDEPVWRLPLYQPYRKLIESPIADLNNAGKDRFAGAITAALFLERFVAGRPWAHLDCYGWTDAAEPGFPVGASGTGVRLLVEAVERLARAGGSEPRTPSPPTRPA